MTEKSRTKLKATNRWSIPEHLLFPMSCDCLRSRKRGLLD